MKGAYTVELIFSEQLSDSQKDAIVHNIASALKNQVETAGLTPEDSSAYTTRITVTRNASDVSVTLDKKTIYGF